MKKNKYILLLLITVLLFGCQDVIEVDLPKDKERLIIDALIRIDNAQLNTIVKIKANISSSFFDEIKPANLEKITISNETNTFNQELIEESPGVYTNQIATELLKDGEITLSILYNNETYIAKTYYTTSVPIDRLIQGQSTLFDPDETEIIITYTDESNTDNFYLFDFDRNEFLVSEDTFYEGQQFEFSYFYDNELKEGETLNISIIGVDESFYNYMNQIIIQSGGDQGPFSTPAGTVRGNIINSTESSNTLENSRENYALGYFAICESFQKSIVIQ